LGVVEREVEGVVAIVGVAEASSPNLPPNYSIYAVDVGVWTASIAAPAAATPLPRCPAVAGFALEVAGRCRGGELAMVLVFSFSEL
jgi:hypothetical protein